MCKGTVLIAEDEKYTRNTLALVLGNDGYQVLEAGNGHEALSLILQQKRAVQPINLLVLDIEMSGFTGWEVLDELKRYQVSVPTIIITGLMDEQVLQRIRNNGGLGYLKKPFVPQEVTACVARALQTQSSL